LQWILALFLFCYIFITFLLQYYYFFAYVNYQLLKSNNNRNTARSTFFSIIIKYNA